MQEKPEDKLVICITVTRIEHWTYFDFNNRKIPEDHWSCIAHMSAEDMLKSAVIEEMKFKNIESE